MNETAFNDWWNASYDAVDNPFKPETPAWWSWAAWQAATKVEREATEAAEWVGLTDEDIKEIIGPWGATPIKGYTRKLFDQIEAKLKEKNK